MATETLAVVDALSYADPCTDGGTEMESAAAPSGGYAYASLKGKSG
jgi:hypothetical protein